MDKLLKLYTYVDGGANDTPFPSADNPIEIGAFRYDAKRMGGAPTITASVNYASCLDDEWTDNVYAMFNGEKFYLKQIPTSSYNNTSAMYKHDIELVSERIALDNVYFFDVVSDDIVDDDKPVSNSTKVVFFGDVREFANRLKASLQYSALDYDVVVDVDVVSEEKLVSFEDQFFSNVLQEIYNTYEVPYYFEGKTIHIGYSKPNEELPSFAYGVDDALLSISKNNANYKVVNRATGTGSSENIPYYYPNNSPKGNIRAELNTTSDDFSINVVDLPTFADKIDLDGDIDAKMVSLSVSSFMLNDEEYTLNHMPQEHVTVNYYQIFRDNVSFVAYSNSAVKGKCSFTIRISQGDSSTGVDASKYMAKIHVGDKTLDPISVVDDKINFEIEVNFEKAGNKEILAEVALSYIPQGQSSIRRAYNVVAGSGLGWFYKDKVIELKNVGIKHQGTPNEGDKITQKLIEYINTSQSLMPSKYRDTKGVERFYNATNDTYEGVTFNNPFVAGKPKEHIFKVEDIKPSIEGMLVNGQRIDMFEAFAYDEDDNDETYQDDDGNVYFKHPYFFAKLKPLGFNLFDHAIEQQPMTISFTSGACGACNFEIAVDEESQKNTVQVDDNGNLVYDENGRVLCGAEGSGQNEVQPQDVQQDTTSRSVWIALQKEEETYGIFMPKAPTNGVGGHRPSTEDTFVILGINLPDEYILNAERRLEAEIIKYLQDNNDEKFTFSIGFSRIYFAENEDVLNSLNENSKIQITYDNKTYDLYVSSFSYTMSESDALPEIKVELDETLKTSQNAIQKAINEVKTTLGSAINEVSQGVAMQRRSYVSKVQDDTAMGVVDFSKGVKFGEGGKVEILDNNSAKLTIEYLEVTKKATFTSLEIQEKTHVGGQMLVTPASMNCGEVEEFEGFYRCYFQTKGADGSEEIFNQFVVGDQAICQTFNAWGSKYYWRLVIGVGEDYIDLSKTDCDEGSGAPEAGDKIIQMGNREDEARQNAIIIAAHGDNSPYIVQYKGINNFDLPKTDNDPRITTLLSPTKNILTGTVKMQAGSEGLENFEAWTQLKDEVDSKVSMEDISGYEYLVESLQQPTEVLGGLILTSNIQLRDSDGSIKSGINGIYMPNALGGGIAAWYGGVMEEGVANAIIRFDGSGYFAKGNLSWDNKGGASFANGKITITPQGALVLSDEIAFGSSEDETINSIITKLSEIMSWFTLDDGTLTTRYNLVVEGDTSSGGEGQDTPASGIRGIYVNGTPYTDEDGDGFIDLGTISGGGGTADLSNYYTKAESDARYLASSLLGSNTLIHSGNVGSYAMRWMGGANTGADVNSFSFAAGAYGVASALNSPTSTGYGAVLNIPYRVGHRNAPDYMGQIYIPNGDDADRSIFYRTSLAETWQPWRRIVSEDDNGNVTLYGTHLYAKNYVFMNSGGEGIYLSTDAISWHNAGNGWVKDLLVFNSSGNVGIGTTSPTSKLDVHGSVAVNEYLVVRAWTGYGSGTCNMWYSGTANTLEISSSVKTMHDLIVKGVIVPSSANTSYIGDFTTYFRTAYINTISSGTKDNNLWLVGGNAVSTTGIQFARSADGSTSGRVGTWDASGLYPAADNAYTLGLNTNRWSSVWAHQGNLTNINTTDTYRTSLTSIGWKKVAVENKRLTSSNVIINIKRIYNNTNNETYTFLINCAYNGQTTITQIGGQANTRVITQIAVYNPASPYDRAIYIYYNTSAANDVIVNCIGDFDAITPEAATLPSSNVKTMNTTSTGFATTGDAVIYGDVASA